MEASSAPAAAPAPAESVQPGQGAPAPAEGQGGQAQGSDLYRQALEGVPEHLRQHVEPVLRQFDGQVTKQFQDRADQLKAFEPYGELGLTDVPPEHVKELLALREVASDPERYREWLEREAQAVGLFEDEGGEGVPTGLEDEGGAEGLTLEAVQEAVKETVSGMLEQRLTPIEQQTRQEQADRAVREQLDKLKEEHGEFDEPRVLQLAISYGDDPEALSKGLADLKAIMGETEQGVFQSKAGQPAPPESGGQPATAPPEIKTFDDAEKAAEARLEQARST